MAQPEPSSPARPVLGAILAGGASRRFGSPKALATVGGRRIVDRVKDALGQAADEVVLVANDAELFAEVGLPILPDRLQGLGPLAGIETALRRAGELGADGALCISCDLPFASPALLRSLASRGGASHAVVPESGRGMGVEPLCAWYPVGVLAEVARALASDDRSLRALLARMTTARLPLDEVRRFGDPGVLFFNVNTRADLADAESIARRIDARS